ncbi:putative serine dehydratase domain-containing protein, partial [Plectosphaerella plurivora]
MSNFIGHPVIDVPKPAAVLDVARARRHCTAMLDTAHRLGISFRAHVKTHKTIELTKLQLGTTPSPRLVVSTIAELEFLLPYLKTLSSVNVLYGIPLPPSQASRAAAAARRLGPESLTFMIDHPSQLAALTPFRAAAGFPPGVYLKVDTGYHRAGLPASHLDKGGLLRELAALEARGEASLVGLYSHSSLSYAGATPADAFDSMAGEIEGCVEALKELRRHFAPDHVVTISVGASPQATAMRNLLDDEMAADPSAWRLQGLLASFASGEVEGVKVELEMHAGVYSVLDLQQLTTRSAAARGSYEDEIALTVAAEVVSVYNDGERKQPEVLIAAGVLALGREPCQGYPGWGVVSTRSTPRLADSKRRLIVARISQEHAILTWEVADGEDTTTLPPIPLEVGQTVFVYPNHACITGAMHRHYFIVDSSSDDSNRVMSVWDRASGW